MAVESLHLSKTEMFPRLNGEKITKRAIRKGIEAYTQRTPHHTKPDDIEQEVLRRTGITTAMSIATLNGIEQQEGLKNVVAAVGVYAQAWLRPSDTFPKDEKGNRTFMPPDLPNGMLLNSDLSVTVDDSISWKDALLQAYRGLSGWQLSYLSPAVYNPNNETASLLGINPYEAYINGEVYHFSKSDITMDPKPGWGGDRTGTAKIIIKPAGGWGLWKTEEVSITIDVVEKYGDWYPQDQKNVIPPISAKDIAAIPAVAAKNAIAEGAGGIKDKLRSRPNTEENSSIGKDTSYQPAIKTIRCMNTPISDVNRVWVKVMDNRSVIFQPAFFSEKEIKRIYEHSNKKRIDPIDAVIELSDNGKVQNNLKYDEVDYYFRRLQDRSSTDWSARMTFGPGGFS